MLPKLLAPAGNLDKLIMAVQYGADEVYFAGKSMGMRAGGKNFTKKDLELGVEYCHKYGRKANITVNIVPHNDDLKGIEGYLKYLHKIGTDALIVADPGVVEIVKETIPDMRIHLSTQANTTNYHTANFWYKQGVNRIVLARELTFDEIETIINNTPDDLEFETFVHGAMCISYSGRCLLSSFMTGRFSNKGDCAQSCRWKYNLVEEKRPGEYYPIEETDEGTFIMNSKDMCMIEHLQKFKDLGIKALKIEGRNKSEYYTAVTVRSYRNALDELEYPESERNTSYWKEEVEKTSHRDFSYGFFFGNPYKDGQSYTNSSYIRTYDVVGIIRSYDQTSKTATVEQRNKFSEGDLLECLGPKGKHFELTARNLTDEDNNKIDSAPHPQQTVKLYMEENAEPYWILRKKVETE